MTSKLSQRSLQRENTFPVDNLALQALRLAVFIPFPPFFPLFLLTPDLFSQCLLWTGGHWDPRAGRWVALWVKAHLPACKSGCSVRAEVHVEAVVKLWSVQAAAGKDSCCLPSQLPELLAQSDPLQKAPQLSIPKFFPFFWMHPRLPYPHLPFNS